MTKRDFPGNAVVQHMKINEVHHTNKGYKILYNVNTFRKSI